MQTELENRLSQLKAPDEPTDLKARCLATVPTDARNNFQSTTPALVHRPVLLRRIVVLGVLMVAAAFWNTRPGNNKTRVTSGSVAFAQTMKAFQQVPFGHVKGRDMEAGILRHGWHARDFFRTEMWFDAERGFYRERASSPSHSQPSIARGTSARALFLPDGISYYRYAGSNTLLVTSSSSHWNAEKESFTSLLAGRWGACSQSSSMSQWKGQKALLFQGEAEENEKAMPGVLRVRTLLYVNPDTKLPIAFQDFVIYSDGVPRLTTEYEFDFTRPDASHFDPALLKKGAVIEHSREIG
jgi:hypothetical protein